MSDLVPGIIYEAVKNTNFRKVVQTGEHTQTVLMSLKRGESIGMEVHKENEQVFFVLEGDAHAEVGGAEQHLHPGDMLTVRPGVAHNITCIGQSELKLITIYSPAHHPEGTIHATKQDAEYAERH